MGEKPPRIVMTILRRFIKRLRTRYSIDKIILFGSRARGDYFAESDIDLVIVSDSFEGVHFLDRIAGVLELWDAEMALEPLCYTRREYEEMASRLTIVQAATAEGIEITLS